MKKRGNGKRSSPTEQSQQKVQASSKKTWENNTKNIFKAEAITVYKTYAERSCWALKKVKSLITKFELQLTQPNKSTDVADFFPKQDGGRSCLFVMALAPFLHDTSNEHLEGIFHFSDVYPLSLLKDNLHLLQAFLTSSVKTGRASFYTLNTKVDSACLL